ncbi:MAG TPA: SCP2 sterol-binding domain-containing protein [Acidimicrobiales bacterium]|nr:SCP2 sterol-binding domain-containing protein [Acidimicrobiales bacterium]
MAVFLSQEWLDLTTRVWAEVLVEPGPSAVIQFVVTGGPGPETAYWWKLEEGRLRQAGTGSIAASGPEPDGPQGDAPGADVTVTQTYADAVAIQTGEMDANAAIMQGRVKVAGDLATLMSILPVMASAPYTDLQRRVGAETEYQPE